MNSSRRTLLRYSLPVLAGLAGTGRFPSLFAQGSAATVVRGAVSVINAGGTNVVVCNTPEGLVLVDSGTPEFSSELVSMLPAINSRGVNTLFNTHWHVEHCGANEAIGKSGARIIASSKTWHHMATEYYLPEEERYHKALPKAALPTMKFNEQGTLAVGDETIDYGPLVEAHTDGDIYVYFRNANVLVAGAAVAPEGDMELDWYGGGWIGGRADSLDLLVAIANDDTLVVPAHGRIMNKAELVAERDLTHALYQRLNDLIRKGCSADCMVQEGALDGLGKTWQDPQRFLYAAYKGLWAHHYNLAPDIL
jgi:cyclase